MPMRASAVTDISFVGELLPAQAREGVARVEALIHAEIATSDPVLRDALACWSQASTPRFRPLFTVLSAQLGPEPDAWQVTVAGAVVELVHLATRRHAEVLNEAQIRQSPKNSNARWANNLAILAGDYLFATASRLVARLGPDAVRIIAESFAQMVTGQMREESGATADEIDHYLKVVDEEMACLIATSGRFGAMFSGADGPQIERLGRLGGIVGTMFQISDDITNLYRGSDETGTLPTIRVREIVHTLPAVYALRAGDPRLSRLREVCTDSIINDGDLTEVLQSLRVSPGMARAKSTLRRFAARAKTELLALPEVPAKGALESLVDYAADLQGCG